MMLNHRCVPCACWHHRLGGQLTAAAILRRLYPSVFVWRGDLNQFDMELIRESRKVRTRVPASMSNCLLVGVGRTCAACMHWGGLTPLLREIPLPVSQAALHTTQGIR
jgi:hypothetical protein